MKTVKKNPDEATQVYHYMNRYQSRAITTNARYWLPLPHLSTASIAAATRTPGHNPRLSLTRQWQCTRLPSITCWEDIDKRSGKITGRWDGRTLTLPQLIEREKKEKSQLAELFNWPAH